MQARHCFNPSAKAITPEILRSAFSGELCRGICTVLGVLGDGMRTPRYFCVLFIFGLLAVNPVNATSLRDAVASAVQTNPTVNAAQARHRANEWVLEQAKGRFFPEIELSGDYGKQWLDRPNGIAPISNQMWQDRRQVTLSVRQVLFDGWDRANDVYRSQARISAASYRILARSEAIALKAIEAYIDIERHRNLLRLGKKQVQRHHSLLRLVQERIDGGRAPISDGQQTRARLEAAKALVAQIEVALETAKAKYTSAVGEEPGRLKSVGYAKGVPKSRGAVMTQAMRYNPRISALNAEVTVANFDREQFRSSLYPQLFIEGNATRGEDLEGTPGRNDELEAKLVLSWKLFDGGVRRSREAELAERQSVKVAEVDILVRDLNEEIGITWARLTKGRAEVVANENQVNQNKQVVVSYKNEFDADKRSLLDVLDAENELFGSEFEYYNTRSLYLFSSYRLLAQMGTLLKSLGIETPAGGEAAVEATYDADFSLIGGDFEIPPLQ